MGGSGLFAIGGGEFAELSDDGGNDTQGEVDIARGGMAAQAETQTGAGLFRRQSDGRENVRRLDRSGGTSGAGGTGQPFEIEGDKEGFAFDSGENDIGGVRRARLNAGVCARPGDPLQETLLQFVSKCRDTLSVRSERFAGKFGCFPEANDTRNVFCARTEAALMVATIEKLSDPGAAPNV